MRRLECLRCNVPMGSIGVKKLQLGQTGWMLGDLPNLIAGALELEIYCCPRCGKIEFFRPEQWDVADETAWLFSTDSGPENREVESVDRDGMPQVRCPACGILHDFDYPKCPQCGHDYYTK